MKEKEYFKNRILELVNGINNAEILSFLYVFVSGIVEREERGVIVNE